MMKFSQNYYGYSSTAMKQVLEQAVGTPVNDENGNQIGTIVNATRTGVETVTFEADIEVDDYVTV
jgi:hypothetical protein